MDIHTLRAESVAGGLENPSSATAIRELLQMAVPYVEFPVALMATMKIFSSRVEIGSGEPLGGSATDRRSPNPSDALEINGLAFNCADGRSYKLCAVDVLYAGRLVDRFSSDESTHVFAASHTHYAPMLDDSKPHMGGFSKSGFDAYVHTLTQAEYKSAAPTQCLLYRAEVELPVYRRFDHPDNWCNRTLAGRFGFYPNDDKEIDKTIYLFEFGNDEQSQFVLAYHAFHPVSRALSCELSADYIAAIRKAARKRLAVETELLLQGCAGDVRPNLTKKRIKWLPKSRLKWKFHWHPAPQIVDQVDAAYETPVLQAKMCRSIALSEQPFEVSHLYHTKPESEETAKFIVSCANKALGYLSHPLQYRGGGYEVNGPLHYTGLQEKLEVKETI